MPRSKSRSKSRSKLKSKARQPKVTKDQEKTDEQNEESELVLFDMPKVRKPQYWQFLKLVAPSTSLPPTQSCWTTKDASFFYCLRCKKQYRFKEGSSNSVSRHMQRFHQKDLSSFVEPEKSSAPSTPVTSPQKVDLKRKHVESKGREDRNKLKTQKMQPVILTAKDLIKTKKSLIGLKAVAKVGIKAGTVIHEMRPPVLNGPNIHSIQYDDKRHIEPKDGAQYVSHSCSTKRNNVQFILVDASGTESKLEIIAKGMAQKGTKRQLKGYLIATRDIEVEEDLCFDYNTTEWDMAAKFACSCVACVAPSATVEGKGQGSSSNSTKWIQGFKHMSMEEQKYLLQTYTVSPYIRKKCFKDATELLELLYTVNSSS